ncbi:right-handed parallel beta-helix repeat-containing protein [Niallia sp. Krafla_26]|uniref:right-handed parallel beta-helix repeat-containing protein n=1 Tax=Niallia sp. Krafla_26 TaxID=3064703 RepID=UPI003D162A3D
MRITYGIMFLLLLSVYLPSSAEATTNSLQSKIDGANPGATIEIQEGEYEETLLISKPLTLVGKGDVLLRSCDVQPLLAISGESVTVKNINLEHCGENNEDTAIYVSGSNHVLDGLRIETKRFGIRLDEANGITIKDSEIVGRRKGNGVDLWRSNRNQLENLNISNVSDGIYLEQSNENLLRNNTIQMSRYGMHLMFSNDNLLSENTSQSNVTGTMVMESKRTSIHDNRFYSNKNNVNSQGLLLYLTSDTEVTNNEFNANRVGVYIEEAENNHINTNKIMNNFIGIQFLNANGNKAVNNTFVGNVNAAQAISSSNNKVNGNYWDTASKVDIDGTGKSNIHFTADPYFLTLTNAVPEYGLFFQAPGLILLQNLLKSPPEQILTDHAPLMDMTLEVERETSSYSGLWIMSAVMILASLSLFLLGRKRR